MRLSRWNDWQPRSCPISRSMTLNGRAWLALAVVASVMCALLFGAAGTIQYWQAWIYVSIFLGASALTTLYLMKKDPALLARRMRGGPSGEVVFVANVRASRATVARSTKTNQESRSRAILVRTLRSQR